MSAWCWCTASIPTVSRISPGRPRTTSTSTATSSTARRVTRLPIHTTRRCTSDLMIRQWTDADNARADAAMASFTEKHGRDALFDTLARGQYRHQDGLMYGGADREWSNRTLETIVTDTLGGAEKVAFIDWHTGIGDYGKPFFLCFNEPASDAVRPRLRLVGQGECRRRAAARHGAAPLYRPGIPRRAALPGQSADVRRGDRVRHARRQHAPRAAARPVAAPTGRTGRRCAAPACRPT